MEFHSYSTSSPSKKKKTTCKSSVQCSVYGCHNSFRVIVEKHEFVTRLSPLWRSTRGRDDLGPPPTYRLPNKSDGSETDADNLVFEEDEIFTINASLDDDENEEDNDYSDEYTLEKPRIEDGLLKDYEETVIEANIRHNRNFDGHSNKKRANKLKRQVIPEEEVTWRYATVDQPEIVYDYEQFKDEYDHEIEQIKKSQGSLNETEFTSQPKSECEADKFYNKGIFTTMCLLNEFHSDDEKLRENALNELTVIAYFWSIILFLLVVVGWAHLGYCNLFCPCSFCFPEDGYEDIKRYLVLNPPGVIVRDVVPKANLESKTVIRKEIYRPTETEHYLYNSLWRTVYNV